MQIQISNQYRPFSVSFGELFPLPHTPYSVRCYPALVEILTGDEQAYALHWGVEGPVQGFCVFLDLEKGCIEIRGTAKNGFFSYRLFGNGENWALQSDRMPSVGLQLSVVDSQKNTTLVNQKMPKNGSFSTADFQAPSFHGTKLSLGNHKKQDWTLIKRRNDPKEIFPFWVALGQQAPYSEMKESSLETETREEELMHLFQVGFEGCFVPRGFDVSHQGLSKLKWDADRLLADGAKQILRMFYSQKGNEFHLLPDLPTDLHCGRIINGEVDGFSFDLEWTKKRAHRMLLKPSQSGIIKIHHRKSIRSCRIRSSMQDQGKRHDLSDPIDLVKGKHVLLDRFER